MTYPHVLGIDLAQSQDYTALSLLEESLWVPENWHLRLNLPAGWVSPTACTNWQLAELLKLAMAGARPPEPPLSIRYLERLQGVPYPAIVERVVSLLDTPPLRRGATMLV